MENIDKFKALKKFEACNHLKALIRLNAANNLANLHLLYTVNRENFIHLLQNDYSEKTSQCSQNIAQAIVYLISNNRTFLKDTIENFANEYQLDFHSLHVAIYAVNLGHYLKLEEKWLIELAIAALFIDVGLKVVDEHITRSNLSLDELKEQNLQRHPVYSVNILEQNRIHNPYIIEAILHHHERYDGSGYPDGLNGDEISQFAAILGICDTFDALTNDRPYRKRLSYFDALKFMLNDPSMQGKFNSNYLKIFLKSLI